MTAEDQLRVQFGHAEDGLLEQGPVAAGEIGSADALIKNQVAGEKGLPLGPVKSKDGRVSGPES